MPMLRAIRIGIFIWRAAPYCNLICIYAFNIVVRVIQTKLKVNLVFENIFYLFQNSYSYLHSVQDFFRRKTLNCALQASQGILW